MELKKFYIVVATLPNSKQKCELYGSFDRYEFEYKKADMMQEWLDDGYHQIYTKVEQREPLKSLTELMEQQGVNFCVSTEPDCGLEVDGVDVSWKRKNIYQYDQDRIITAAENEYGEIIFFRELHYVNAHYYLLLDNPLNTNLYEFDI